TSPLRTRRSGSEVTFAPASRTSATSDPASRPHPTPSSSGVSPSLPGRAGEPWRRRISRGRFSNSDALARYPESVNVRQRRLVELITDPVYLVGLQTKPIEELRAMREECGQGETELSFERRLCQ